VNTTLVRRTAGWAVVLLALAAPAALHAQAPAGPAAEGLVFERMQSGFVVAPDVRFTEMDGRYGTLVGGTAGWLTDDTLLIGAGGYWLTDGGRDRGLGYGGLVLEWSAHRSRRVGVSLRGLVGFGSGTLPVTVSGPVGGWDRDRRHGVPGGKIPTGTFTALVDNGFFVAEPEARATVLVTRWLRLGAGVGYRFIGSSGSFNSRLDGVSGSVSVQLGSF